MNLFKAFFNQTRKPEGFLGKMMLKRMNPGHASLADWGIAQLPALSVTSIAELGCGGGRNIAALLKKYPAAKADGIDHSPLSVKNAVQHNADAIKGGRCTVTEGDVSAMPFGTGVYDLATAFETVYFWPGLTRCFREVYRILKPGGVFLIVHESDGTDSTGKKFETLIDGMTIYTAQELKNALEEAHFQEVSVFHHQNRPWIAVVAKK